MTRSSNINTYTDCKLLFSKIANAGGGRFTCPNPKEAVKLRARLHKFRQLAQMQAQEALGDVPGVIASTPYDPFILSLDEASIIFRRREIEGVLTDLEGNPIGETTAEIPADPLLREALNFALDLDGDEE